MSGMVKRAIRSTRKWTVTKVMAVALGVVVVSNGLGWMVMLQQQDAITKTQAENERQDEVDAAVQRSIARVAICTKDYLTADAQARDERVVAVKPRDAQINRFIKAVAALRGSDGSDPVGDKKKVDELLAAADAAVKAAKVLDGVRATDYPAYTCDEEH